MLSSHRYSRWKTISLVVSMPHLSGWDDRYSQKPSQGCDTHYGYLFMRNGPVVAESIESLMRGSAVAPVGWADYGGRFRRQSACAREQPPNGRVGGHGCRDRRSHLARNLSHARRNGEVFGIAGSVCRSVVWHGRHHARGGALLH